MNDDFKNYIQLLIDNKDKIIHLPERDIHNLLDYITNLQQEIETRQYDINNLTYQLAKEKEENKHLDKVNCQLRKKINNDIYKSRIEKAIKYIENTPLYETTYDYNMEEELEIQNVSDETASNKLLNILNGDKSE